MKNKNRPAVTRDVCQQVSSKENVLIVETRNGTIEIDLSDAPEPPEIFDNEIPELEPEFRFAAQRYGHELIDTWMNGYPRDLDDETFIAHYSILQDYQHSLFDELLSSNLVDSLKSLSHFIKSYSISKGIVEVFLLEKLIEEKKVISGYESIGFQKFSVTNSDALKRVELLVEVLRPGLRFDNLNDDDETLMWTYDFSDFCEIVGILCDAKSFGDKNPIKVFRILKKFIRFRTSASDASFTSTASTNRGRQNPLSFYDLLKSKYLEAEKSREREYGKNAGNNRLKRLK